jgi:lipid A 3-O-deacylase
MRRAFPVLALALALAGSPARASELFGGLLAHDVDTPLSKGGRESGLDLQFGWRGGRIGALGFIGAPAPYAFVAAASSGGTHVAAAGLSWRIGGRLFARPGVGIAVHSRSSHGSIGGIRTDLGSRVLFEPEFGIGYQLSERVAIEGTWVHVSHAQLFSRQNPGMDSIGIRLTFALR